MAKHRINVDKTGALHRSLVKELLNKRPVVLSKFLCSLTGKWTGCPGPGVGWMATLGAVPERAKKEPTGPLAAVFEVTTSS